MLGPNLNPANRCEREDLQARCDQSLAIDNSPTFREIPKQHCIGRSIGDDYLAREELKKACLAAQQLLENGEASGLTVAYHADEVAPVLNQLTLVLGKSA